MNVCDALLEILADHGVKFIFGIPGDAINELTESIRKQDRIRFIHVMHEEAGAFAASAQAKLSGGLAACVGTAGPGAIHLLNGLYDAKMDQAPVIAITGQVETALQGTAYMQEVNLLSLFVDVNVFNEEIVNAEQIPEVVTLACQTALAKRGVSHLSLPSNISVQKVKGLAGKKQVVGRKIRSVPHADDLREAAELINRSKRVCILAGIGARDAADDLLSFAVRIHAPIVKALRGKDLLPDEHHMTMGGIGLLGTEPSVYAMKNCDLLIAIGTDFPYHEFYPQGVPVIQVDDKVDQIGRRAVVSHPLPGDAHDTLKELMKTVQPKSDSSYLDECGDRKEKWLRELDQEERSDDTPVHPQRLARSVSTQADKDAIICCDTGAVTVWGARNFRLRGKQRFTLSGDLASMAFALPASIGAKLLYPERQVIALCGDGGFAMLMADFATAVKYELDIKVFIFNNGKLGLIQMEQEAHSGNPEYETDLQNPDYAAFADICGGVGFTVNAADELEHAIEQAMRTEKPAIVNVHINPGELTIPPVINAAEAINYGKAKVKEFFIRQR
jgi:pyruvate oxidase